MSPFYILDNVIDILIQCGVKSSYEKNYTVALIESDYNYLLLECANYCDKLDDNTFKIKYASFSFLIKKTDNNYN